jgi:hypothetical protein
MADAVSAHGQEPSWKTAVICKYNALGVWWALSIIADSAFFKYSTTHGAWEANKFSIIDQQA